MAGVKQLSAHDVGTVTVDIEPDYLTSLNQICRRSGLSDPAMSFLWIYAFGVCTQEKLRTCTD